jgi:thiol-disulfide isomerase/thioredoxin
MTTQTKKKTYLLGKVLLPVFSIFILIIGALYWIRSEWGHNPHETSVEIREGTILPPFSLKTIEGKSVSMKSIPHKVVLINFWATWCEACLHEMPSLIELRNSYHSRGFEIFGINLDENPEGVVPQTVGQFHIPFPIFKDPEGSVADLFDIHAIPLTVILNQDRKILYVKDGEQNWNSPAIRALVERWLTE